MAKDKVSTKCRCDYLINQAAWLDHHITFASPINFFGKIFEKGGGEMVEGRVEPNKNFWNLLLLLLMGHTPLNKCCNKVYKEPVLT